MDLSVRPEIQPCELVNVFAGGPHALDRQNNHRTHYSKQIAGQIHQTEQTSTQNEFSDPHVRYSIFTNSLQVLFAQQVDQQASPYLVLVQNGSELVEQASLSPGLPKLVLGERGSESSGETERICAVVSTRSDSDLISLAEKEFHTDRIKFFTSDVRTAAVNLKPDNPDHSTLRVQDTAVCAQAKSLFEFHRRHRFCGLCGSPTHSDQGGSRRICNRNTVGEGEVIGGTVHDTHDLDSQCSGIVFPRQDPVIITAICHPTKKQVLLARSPRFPVGMYSAIAGFMEHGESIEDAVRREALEEVGLHIGKVEYFASQPWPFPYSLMIGCIAYSLNEHIHIDAKEIQDAFWIDMDELKVLVGRASGKSVEADTEMEHGDVKIPPPGAIAHQLLNRILSVELTVDTESSELLFGIFGELVPVHPFGSSETEC